jgi:hypothetical protein
MSLHTSVEGIIEDFILANGRRGRTGPCAAIEWLSGQRGRAVDVVRAEMLAHPDFGVELILDVLSDAHHNPRHRSDSEGLAAIQRRYVRALTTHDFAEHRPRVERFMSEHAEHLGAASQAALLAWISASHPNPKAFFAGPHVNRRIAETTDLSDLPSPDFPELEDALLRGSRRASGE